MCIHVLRNLKYIVDLKEIKFDLLIVMLFLIINILEKIVICYTGYVIVALSNVHCKML